MINEDEEHPEEETIIRTAFKVIDNWFAIPISPEILMGYLATLAT